MTKKERYQITYDTVKQAVDEFNKTFNANVFIRSDSFIPNATFVTDHSNGNACDINAEKPEELLKFYIWLQTVNNRELNRKFPIIRGCYIADHNRHLHCWTTPERQRRYAVESYVSGNKADPTSYTFPEFFTVWNNGKTLQSRYGSNLSGAIPPENKLSEFFGSVPATKTAGAGLGIIFLILGAIIAGGK